MSILQRIELNFWQIATPLIRDSTIVRFILKHLYFLARKKLVTDFVIPAAFFTASGFLLGIVWGMLSY